MNTRENPIPAWLQARFEDWRYQKGVRKTVTEFASYIGISEDLLLRLMNGSDTPKGSSLAKIAGMLGYDVYELVGIKTSEMLDALPPICRIRFASAFTDYFETIKAEEIDKDSPEAQKIFREKMKKYNLQEIFC